MPSRVARVRDRCRAGDLSVRDRCRPGGRSGAEIRSTRASPESRSPMSPAARRGWAFPDRRASPARQDPLPGWTSSRSRSWCCSTRRRGAHHGSPAPEIARHGSRVGSCSCAGRHADRRHPSAMQRRGRRRRPPAIVEATAALARRTSTGRGQTTDALRPRRQPVRRRRHGARLQMAVKDVWFARTPGRHPVHPAVSANRRLKLSFSFLAVGRTPGRVEYGAREKGGGQLAEECDPRGGWLLSRPRRVGGTKTTPARSHARGDPAESARPPTSRVPGGRQIDGC